MTAEVEQRIVEMRFDNEQFEKGAKKTLSTLEKLDGILDMLGSGGGMEHLSNALSSMEYRFSRIGIIGATALQNISNKAMGLAANLLTAIPEQIVSGGTQRALNIENAKFQLKGLGAAWEDVADDIDHAVMGTAYGVDEAAKIAAILVGSGVDFKNATEGVSDMGKVLRSISGLAAMTNSSYEDIGNLMGDIFAMGKLATRQLQSFELRGLNVAAKLSEVLRNANGNIQYTEAEIRDLVSQGKIDAMTFAKAMDAAFGEHATAANETYTGSLRNMKAALSRIGADFVTPLHEGERQVMLSLRKAFDNVRKITKPFAEGRFADVIQSRAEKLSKIFAGWDFRWLERIQQFLNGSDSWVRPMDWAIERLSDLNEITRRLFASGEGREGIGDRFEWVFKLKNWGQQQGRKIVKIFQNIRDAGKGASDIFKTLRQNAGKLAETLGKILSRRLDRFSEWTEKLKDSGKAAKAIETVRKALDKLGDAASAFARLGGSAFELLLAIFEKLLSKLGGGGRFRAFGDILGWIADKAILASGKLSGFLEKLTDIIRNDASISGALGKIGSGFESIGNFAGGAVTAISTFLRYILGLKEGENVFTRFGELASGAGEAIREVFRDIREALQGAFGENGSGKEAVKIAAALYTVLLGYRQFESKKWAFGRFSKAFEFLKELLTKSYEMIRSINPLQWADDIETLLRRTSGALRAFADNLNAKSLLTIGGAIVALAFGLTILAGVSEGGHLGPALGALTATMALLVGSLWAIKTITDQGLFKNIAKGWSGLVDVFKNSISKYFNAVALKETATAMLMFAAAVGVLAIALGVLGFAFSRLGPANMWQAVGAITILSAVLAGAILLLTRFTKDVGMFDSTKFVAIGIAMAAFSFSILLLAAAVSLLAAVTAKISYGPIWSAVGAITALTAILGGLTVALSMFAKNPLVILSAAAMALVAAAIDILIAGLIGLGIAVKLIGGGELWNAIGMIAVLAVILGGLTTALSMFAPLALLAAPAAVMIALAMDILIAGLIGLGVAVSAIGGGKLWNAIGMIAVLSVIFVGLMTVVGLLSPILLLASGVFAAFSGVAKNLSEAFVNMAEGMVVLATALNMLPSDGSLEVIGKGLGSIAGGLAKMGAAMLLMPAKSEDIYSGLIALGTAMTVMQDIDIAKLADKKTGLPALSDALREAFGGSFFGLFGSLGASMGVGSAGLLAAGPALLSLGEGLKALTPGLEAFSQVENTDAIAEHLEAITRAVNSLSDFAYGRMAKNMPTLLDNLERFGPALDGITDGDTASIEKLGSALGETFSKDKGKAAAALADELETLHKTLRNNAATFESAALALGGSIGTGITGSEPVVTKAVFTLLWAAAAAANDQRLRQNWNTIGGNIAIGIANGIAGRTAEAANAMTRLAGALQRSFTVSLAIRSPSRVFEALAAYIPQGIARGIQNGSGEITTSMVNSMTGAMDVLDQYARGAQSLAPQITPVMDMNRMRQEFSYADRMFQRSGIGSFSGFSGLTVNGDAISYNMQNRDVVGELKQMSNKINRLGQAIEQMQIVLDSGVLVGQLAPGMNRELGTMAVWEGRQ